MGKQGSCKGDSGGPLMIQDLESKRWVQIGTVAGSVGDCGDINLPGIYVRLNHPSVSNFIDSVIYPLKKQTKGKMKEVISAKAFFGPTLATAKTTLAYFIGPVFVSPIICNCLSHYI